MGYHSLSEARDQLADLIRRAREGEGVVITQDGEPVAEIRALAKTEPPARPPLTDEDIEWLRAHRVGTKLPSVDAATLIRRMRDDDDH